MSDSDITSLKRLTDLTNCYCNGTISADELRELEELLAGSADARRAYREQMFVHASLSENADLCRPEEEPGGIEAACTIEVSESESTALRARGRYSLIGSLVVALTFAVLLAAYLFSRPPAEFAAVDPVEESSPGDIGRENLKAFSEREIAPTQHQLTSLNPVAVVDRVAGAVWIERDSELRAGDPLQPCELKLAEGIATVVFFSGASVVLEGPAELEIISSLQGVLKRGKVRVHVPPQARGFSLETQEAKYVDLGTEFALRVTDNGNEELHVFEGQVEVRTPQKNVTLVNSGEALAVESSTTWKSITPAPEDFTTSGDVSRLAVESGERRFAQWKSHSRKVSEHPQLVAYFDFEPEPGYRHLLVNRKDEDTSGIIVGCEWAEGRWPGKSSLEFKRPNDRVRLSIPGEFNSLTMTSWLRIDGFDRFFNSILLTDRFEDGDVHWQIKSSGKLDVGIKPLDKTRLLFLSKPVLNFDDLGRWIHVATVIDQHEKTVSHYLNGQRVYRGDLTTNGDNRQPVEIRKLRIGDANLGNWQPVKNYDEWLVRNLNGRIDEFSVYSTALSEDEIFELWQIGNPH